MTDPTTLAAYAQRAQDYARLTRVTEPSAELLAFITAVPAGGRVLDLGCGPGHDAALMTQAGLQVDALDAVAEMVALAQAAGVAARLGQFQDLPLPTPIDGIWASFSLLHAQRVDLPAHLRAIHASLVVGGAFHLSMKLGHGEGPDTLGRHYTYYQQAELETALHEAGFSVISATIGSAMGMAGQSEPYVTVQTHA